MEISQTFKQKISEYGIAEDKGVHLLTQMQEFVPEGARTFLNEQIKDERRHAILFSQRAEELGVKEPFFLDCLTELYDLAQSYVDKKSWLACMVMQSVIEELAMVTFGQLYKEADPSTRRILQSIIKDEQKHLDFTFEQLEEHVVTEADQREVNEVHERVLYLFLNALKPGNMNKEIPKEHQASFISGLKQAYLLHKKRFKAIGIKVPTLSSLSR